MSCRAANLEVKSRSIVSHLFWLVLGVVVVVSESTIATFAPGVEASIVKDTGRVGGATLNVDHTFAFHSIHKPWSVDIAVDIDMMSGHIL